MKILGINSGTSVDSLDIGLFECKENKIAFIKGVEVKYPNVLREEIKSLGPNSSILNCDRTSINLGKFVGMKTNLFLKSNNLKASLIGMHGQTIHHSNEVNKWSAGCQVFAITEDFNEFIDLCKMQEKMLKAETFTYTLLLEE